MRDLGVFALVAFIGCSAQAQETPLQRDGAWLQNGIELYRRLSAHENLPDKQTNEARVASSYVCAVVDLEKYLVFRADLLKDAVAGAKKRGRMNRQQLRGMDEALPMLIPLMGTGFVQDSPSCDKALRIVRDYLVRYPEVLTKDADTIVELALLQAYSNVNQP
jgi:hypothetical protein